MKETMKILIVAPLALSYPPKDGYSMVVCYTSYFLKKLFNVDSDIIVPEDENYSIKDLVFSEVFNNVFSYRINNKWTSLIKSFFSKDIYTMIRHDIDDADLDKILKKINSNKYEALIFHHSFSYPLYKKLINRININKERIIYWSHNIDYIYVRNLLIDTNNFVKKIFYFITYKKLKKIELDYIKKFTKIVSVANHETKTLKEINSNASIYWVPPILPNPDYVKNEENYLSNIKENVKNYKYKILFTGRLDIPSNIFPAIWFANKVFPLIKRKLNVCFIIVGKNPSRELVDLVKDRNDIFLFPNVPSLAPFYEISDLVVVPLFNPAGIKLKLIEALKFRKKVVARPEALLGTGLEKIVPNATEPEDFAEKCIRSLKDEIDFNIIWDKFNEIYNEEKIINKLKDILFNKENYENF